MWELVSFLQGRMRRLCLECLALGPKTPNMMARSHSEHLSHTSRALKELEEKELVRCVTPSSTKNRFYEITKLGEKSLAKLKDIESRT